MLKKVISSLILFTFLFSNLFAYTYTKYDYENNLKTKYTYAKWQKVGTHRRAGVLCPLFSIYSKNSIGIGEFRDLKLLVDWCVLTKNSIIELLPLNEAGFGNSPYSSPSSFALEPVYISLDNVIGVNLDIKKDLDILRKKYPTNSKYVDYKVRIDKLKVLKKMFKKADLNNPKYLKFKTENAYWLDEYVLFKLLYEKNNKKSWSNWNKIYEIKSYISLLKILNSQKLEFQKWLQWQLFEQLKDVHAYAKKNKVLLMGDIPFLVDENSSDVWGKWRKYFDMTRVSGAPPDFFNDNGQRWGMPSYKWDVLKKDNYIYYKYRLKYLSNFFDMYRIDHAIGLLRLWTIAQKEPTKTGGLNGSFNPKDEALWKAQGEEIFKAMIDSTDMLPIAEDLGNVPQQAVELLDELGINGTEIPRWAKVRNKKIFTKKDFQNINKELNADELWNELLKTGYISKDGRLTLRYLSLLDEIKLDAKFKKYIPAIDDVLRYSDESLFNFIKPEDFRPISVAMPSTHDTSNLGSAWFNEMECINDYKINQIASKDKLDLNKIKNDLFDLAKSKKDKLFWKKDLKMTDILDNPIIKKSPELKKILIKLYRETFNEKKNLFKVMNLDEKNIDTIKTDEILWEFMKYSATSTPIFFVNSIYDILLFNDYKYLDGKLDINKFRCNAPGTLSKFNWSLKIPMSLENLQNIKANNDIKELIINTERDA